MKITKLLLLILIPVLSHTVSADFKISQKTTIEDVTNEVTVYSKGVRERHEQKTVVGEMDAETAAMMAAMMPSLTRITQCDLKQDVTLNTAKKAYFIDYYDWSGLSPDQMKRLPKQKITIRGTSTMSSVVIDSGRRQQMFGLTARWQKSVLSIVTSEDSCVGASDVRMEQEGWFVDIKLDKDVCQVPRVPESEGGCRPKVIVKSMQNPGFMLEGTTKSFDGKKLTSTIKLETTALTQSPLDQSLFEIPEDFNEADSMSELMQGGPMLDTSATTIISDDQNGGKQTKLKTVAIDFFSGNASKVNQEELRGYISEKLSSAGLSGFPINSQSDLISGNFVNIIAVDLKRVKQSGASKIGGLFGKISGNDDAAKIGETEAEIVISILARDGKTVVASDTATVKAKGSANDAVKSAIDQILGGLLRKIQ